MTTRLPRSPLAAAAAASLALVLPASSLTTATAAEDGTGSANLSHVTTLKHRKAKPTGAAVAAGTDIEFATIATRNAAGELEDREYALAGTYQNGLQIVDVTDPTKPFTKGVYDCAISQGDVQVFARAGRTYAAYTADNGYGVGTTSACVKEAKALGPAFAAAHTASGGFGTYIADITDPAAPVTVSYVGNPQGSHNQTVAPGGEYLYNSNSDIGAVDGRMSPTDQTGRIEVYDIKDLRAPKQVATLPLQTGADSHDITFSADGKRAYTAALTHTLVLDTTNLAAPKVVGRIVDPAVNIHHQSDPVTLKDATTGLERTFLVVSDELAGAAGNAVCPGGGLHVYDVTGPLEAAPVKVGFWAMPSVQLTTDNLTCTSHVLRMHPEHKMMTIAWYAAGVRVVDISGLTGISVGAAETAGNAGAGMKEVGFHYFPDSDTWSAKTNKIAADGSFYLFGNDQARGLDVYRYTRPRAAEATDPGTWLTPSETLAAAQSRGSLLDGVDRPFCLRRV